MSLESKLDRPKSLTDLAVERIRAAIVEGGLAFGEQLSEAALAVNLGISKTPVREALLRLRMDGLVDIQPQRGTFVFTLDADEVKELTAFREIIETEALGLAMRRDRAGLVDALRANLARMPKGKGFDPRRVHALDTEFHETIVGASGNRYLIEAYALAGRRIEALRYRLPVGDAQVEHCQQNHARIVARIADGDVRRAGSALREHVLSTRDSYLAASRNRTGGR
jgi:DNA-binding GntR family transcriptional regulator